MLLLFAGGMPLKDPPWQRTHGWIKPELGTAIEPGLGTASKPQLGPGLVRRLALSLDGATPEGYDGGPPRMWKVTMPEGRLVYCPRLPPLQLGWPPGYDDKDRRDVRQVGEQIFRGLED